MLTRRGKRGCYLADARVLVAQPAIYLLQKLGLGLEGMQWDGVSLAIEVTVSAGRCDGERTGITVLYGGDRVGKQQKNRLGKIARMRIAFRFARNGAQDKALASVDLAFFRRPLSNTSASPSLYSRKNSPSSAPSIVSATVLRARS